MYTFIHIVLIDELQDGNHGNQYLHADTELWPGDQVSRACIGKKNADDESRQVVLAGSGAQA